MKNFSNRKQAKHLSSFSEVSLDDKKNQLAQRCKFNFHYMDFGQPAGQTFEDWEKDGRLAGLLNKLKDYCGQPLKYWLTQSQRVGRRSHNVLEIYGHFPRKSEFTHPRHVPHQAEWARFRLENTVRLIGFVIPNEYNGKPHEGTKTMFDRNTFCAVFLDKKHKFYKSERP